MQIVIDIADDIYEDSRKYMSWEWRIVMAIRNAIVNGTPLPKGHGRLIDADKIIDQLTTWESSEFFGAVTNGEIMDLIGNAPTIIEEE